MIVLVRTLRTEQRIALSRVDHEIHEKGINIFVIIIDLVPEISLDDEVSGCFQLLLLLTTIYGLALSRLQCTEG